MSSGTRNNIPTDPDSSDPDSSTLPECHTEVNEVSPATSEMVLVAQKMTELPDMHTELVVGNLSIPCKPSFHLCC